MSRTLHPNIKLARAIDAGASLGATGSGGITSKVVDRNGFESVEFAVNVAAITATGATITAKILEGSATNALATAGATAILGNIPTLIGATSARASGVSMNVPKRVGYKGALRYVAIKLIPTVSGAIKVGAEAILGNPHYAPTASN